MSLKIILFLSCCVLSVSSYKILVIMSAPIKSHHNLGKAAADILHENGHEITFVSAFSSKSNYTEITIPELSKIKDDMNIGFDMVNRSIIGSIKNFTDKFLPAMISTFMENDKIKKLQMNSNFDLVVMEYFINEALLGFAVKFDCPALVISSLPMLTSLNELSRNLMVPSITPNMLFPFDNHMTFIQRAKNFGAYVSEIIVNHFIIFPAQAFLYEKYFPNEATNLKFDKISEKIAMVLINSHPVINHGRPLFPNAVEIAGFHVDKPEPLPRDLQTILDNAKDGAIYFSLGSNLITSTMDEILKKNILKALGSLKYPVLWKFEDELKDKPKNVFIRKWMPQTSILGNGKSPSLPKSVRRFFINDKPIIPAHKNVKMFISHAGLLSTIEATSFGIPTLNIPIFGDQQNNAYGAELRGTSITLDVHNITETSLVWAITEMMENHKYFDAAQNLKHLFSNHPINPRDALNFYAEYVIKTKGAEYLKPPMLKYYQLLSLDVIFVFILLPLFITILIIYNICRLCKRKLLKRKLKTQ